MCKRKKLLLALLISLLLICFLSACKEQGSTGGDINTGGEPVYYTVKFDTNGGDLISGSLEQTVPAGTAAEAPVLSYGKRRLKWDTDFSNVTSDITVKAEWIKTELTEKELAEYGQKCTVAVITLFDDGDKMYDSGFFIDGEGTFVTTFNVAQLAERLIIVTEDGKNHRVEKVVAFDVARNLAILKIDVKSPDYLKIYDGEVAAGDYVYQIRAKADPDAETFRSGMIWQADKKAGVVECIRTNLAPKANEGGPVINSYGEVVGVTYTCTARYIDYDAIRACALGDITEEKNFTAAQMENWFDEETSKSYLAYYKGYYYKTYINNYQTVTGVACDVTMDEKGNMHNGYYPDSDIFAYDYTEEGFEKYTKYLAEIGFMFKEIVNEDDGSKSYWYIDALYGKAMELVINANKDQVYILPYWRINVNA